MKKKRKRKSANFSGSKVKFEISKKFSLGIAWLASLLGLVDAQELTAPQWSLSGKTYFETSLGLPPGSSSLDPWPAAKESSFESWTDFRAQYGDMALNLEATAFIPPRTFNTDTTSPQIRFMNFEIQRQQGTLLVGHYYGQLGNGLVFRSYRDDLIRYNTAMRGIYYRYQGDFLSAQVLGGQPRDLLGGYNPLVHGAELKLKPWNALEFGATGLKSNDLDSSSIYWSSLLAKVYLPQWELFGGSFAGEYAVRDPQEEFTKRGIYGQAELYLGPVNGVFEYKDYYSFENKNGAAIINNPPLVSKEHIFTLMARKQLQVDASDQKGWASELSYTWSGPVELGFKANGGMTENSAGVSLFEEWYGQTDLTWGSALWSLGGGVQRDVETDNLNLVLAGNFPLSANYFIKSQVEHQHSTVKAFDEKKFSQIYRLACAIHRKVVLGMHLETEVKQLPEVKDASGSVQAPVKTKTSIWPGLQVDWHANDRMSLTIYRGMRKEGKDCSGGVCVYKPEFNGLEVLGNLTF
jgi:hypothetical protein